MIRSVSREQRDALRRKLVAEHPELVERFRIVT